MCSIFQELQIVHETGYFSALPSLEEYWQQVNAAGRGSLRAPWQGARAGAAVWGSDPVLPAVRWARAPRCHRGSGRSAPSDRFSSPRAASAQGSPNSRRSPAKPLARVRSLSLLQTPQLELVMGTNLLCLPWFLFFVFCF